MPDVRRLVFFMVLTGAAIGLCACENTIRGAGQDVSQTADAVEDAAKEATQ